MRIFLQVSFGTVTAVATALALVMVMVGLAEGDWELVQAAALLWGLLAVVVLLGWGLWGFGRWGWRRLRRR